MKVCDSLALSLQRERGYGIISLEMSRNIFFIEKNSGTVRETFFLNQLRCAGHKVVYPAQGDFLVGGRYLFEIGGRGKGLDQIKDIPDSFVVNDGVETGIGKKIPLWLFGFLY